ncbi:MAG: ribosome maturation factor RimM [Gammaproteobacteria bacterium]|jgi:16S rRNA processing protein RimM|nr:ribosome maturation factor RimM [Gammaproteobacteria bacterium]
MAGCGSGCAHDHSHDSREVVLVIVGKMGAPFGIEGWQHVQSFTNPVNNILQYEQWYVQTKDEWLPLTLDAGRPHGQGIVVKLQGIEDPETAALLTNGMIAVERAALAELPQNEFYWTDLEGLAVVTEAGEFLGEIQFLYENAETDVMVVKDNERERHIPFVMEDTVLKVDFAAKQVTVDWDPAL